MKGVRAKSITLALSAITIVLLISNVYFATKPPHVIEKPIKVVIPPPAYPVTVTDFLGREVTLHEFPARIVTCAPSVTEVAAFLNLTEFIVGTDKFSDFPPIIPKMREEGKIADIGLIMPLSVEAVAALKPNLVLIHAGMQGGAVPKLEELGLTVVALGARNVEEVYAKILTVAILTNRTDAAKRAIERMRERVEEVRAVTAAVMVKLRTLTIFWLEPIWTTGRETFMHHIIRTADGYNIFVDAMGWISVSPEPVIMKDPEVMIVCLGHLMLGPEEAMERLMAIPGFEGLSAIKQGRVYLLHGQAENVFLREGPRVIEAIELLAKILYPELFKVEPLPTVIGDDYVKYVSPIFPVKPLKSYT